MVVMEKNVQISLSIPSLFCLSVLKFTPGSQTEAALSGANNSTEKRL